MYVVKCKSRFSGSSSICQENGKVLIFKERPDAEKYAKECIDFMGSGYHYWVEEE